MAHKRKCGWYQRCTVKKKHAKPTTLKTKLKPTLEMPGVTLNQNTASDFTKANNTPDYNFGGINMRGFSLDAVNKGLSQRQVAYAVPGGGTLYFTADRAQPTKRSKKGEAEEDVAESEAEVVNPNKKGNKSGTSSYADWGSDLERSYDGKYEGAYRSGYEDNMEELRQARWELAQAQREFANKATDFNPSSESDKGHDDEDLELRRPRGVINQTQRADVAVGARGRHTTFNPYTEGEDPERYDNDEVIPHNRDDDEYVPRTPSPIRQGAVPVFDFASSAEAAAHARDADSGGEEERKGPDIQVAIPKPQTARQMAQALRREEIAFNRNRSAGSGMFRGRGRGRGRGGGGGMGRGGGGQPAEDRVGASAEEIAHVWEQINADIRRDRRQELADHGESTPPNNPLGYIDEPDIPAFDLKDS
jgi:hypothetical protein